MEIIGVVDVLDFSWLNLLLESSKVIFAVLSLVLGSESIFNTVVQAGLILFIDGFASGLGEALTIQILAVNLRDVSGVTWNVLSLDVAIWATNPVLSLHRLVAELNGLRLGVLERWSHLIVVLLIVWLRDGNVNIIL